MESAVQWDEEKIKRWLKSGAEQQYKRWRVFRNLHTCQEAYFDHQTKWNIEFDKGQLPGYVPYTE